MCMFFIHINLLRTRYNEYYSAKTFNMLHFSFAINQQSTHILSVIVREWRPCAKIFKIKAMVFLRLCCVIILVSWFNQ